MLVRTVECLDGHVEIELVCTPVFDYGRTPANWTAGRGRPAHRRRDGGGQTVRLRTDLAVGIEGNRVRARRMLETGDRAFCALSWADGLAAPETSTRPRPGSTRPPATGAPGSPAPGSPTTGGAPSCNARR